MVKPLALPRFTEVEDPDTQELWVLHMHRPIILARVLEDARGAFTGLEKVPGWGDDLRPEDNPARLLREMGEWYRNVLDSND